MAASAVKYTMGEKFLSVVLPGKGVFTLDDTHATFPALKRALKKKQWARVPHLVSLAEKIANETHGKVSIVKGVPTYKGKPITGYLGDKLAQMARRGEKMSSLLKFADNLHQNPDPATIPEVLEFLEVSKMPITDDGCFLAYKCVRNDYMDCHSGKYDNSPGETPAMPRQSVDNNTRVACSSGFHFAALDYISGSGHSWAFGEHGNRVVMIKINPRDVVAIPAYKSNKKGRTWFYEVVKELFTIEDARKLQDHPEMLQTVVAVAKERRELIKWLLAHPAMKRAIRRGSIKKSTIVKQTYGRLQKMATKLGPGTAELEPTKEVKVAAVLTKNPLKALREKAGLSIGQVAKEAGMTYKAVYAAEKATAPTQETIDKYLAAINKLTDKDYRPYPKTKAAAASTSTPSTTSSYSDNEEEEEDEDYSDGYEYDGEDDD